jgi:hypothetical protein
LRGRTKSRRGLMPGLVPEDVVTEGRKFITL